MFMPILGATLTTTSGTTHGKLSKNIKSGKEIRVWKDQYAVYGGYGIAGTGNDPPTTTKNGSTGVGERLREDAAKDTAGSAAERAKAGVVGAMESGLKFGEMAKETMDRVWDEAKETTENVRDAVADDRDNDDDRRKEATDKHVEDLRRMARGYDLKDD